MKRVSSVSSVCQEINSYVEHFDGAPLLVGLDSRRDYILVRNAMEDDPDKQILRLSDACTSDFPPNPTFEINNVRMAAQQGTVVWLGAGQSIMLYGRKHAEEFFINLAGTSIHWPVVVLIPYCCSLLEAIDRKYVKLGRTILLLPDEQRNIPTITFYPNEAACMEAQPDIGIKELLRELEDGRQRNTIPVVTSCKPGQFDASMFPLREGMSAYEAICAREPGIASAVPEQCGSAKQWEMLARQLAEGKGFSELCAEKLCAVSRLPLEYADYLLNDGSAFLCFVALKTFYSAGSDYLAACLRKAGAAQELLPRLYDTILDCAVDDPQRLPFLRQRRRQLQAFDENSVLMQDYCNRATIRGRDVLYYLSDETEEERSALIHALCCYDYSAEELNVILKEAAPNLALYLQRFVFDAFNTRVLESDAQIHDLLTSYFERYKLQKLTNRIDEDFVQLVEQQAAARSFTKLQLRSSIVKRLDKKDARVYFFDALGVEYLAFIAAKAEEYGMQFDCQIGHCNLPSITCLNKEFYDAFPKDTILKQDGIDALKHHGTMYDYRITTEPLHTLDELDLLDRELKKMSCALATGQISRIIILSDHGASRLAVTYESENDRLELEERGQHSGRCCPADEDPHIPFAYYENGFAVLANYGRFKGSRRADVEAHGGASLEETLVPVITLTAAPKQQIIVFVESTVKCSPKDGSSILLYANPPLKNPRMVVSGTSYSGFFEGDRHNVRFTMTDLRRKGKYDAEIYDGGRKLATLCFETKRSTGTNELF